MYKLSTHNIPVSNCEARKHKLQSTKFLSTARGHPSTDICSIIESATARERECGARSVQEKEALI